ncbi:hypothetical protein ElyMa_002052700 [Elysia marginata]|uniref:Secreted protein n=1 Tax=Elysia marginata TaxID=1093978 RepID=A0AAV4F9P7_9GAST|nr:hypothetical protein ElyMa_002052700 [Elysia marginata]
MMMMMMMMVVMMSRRRKMAMMMTTMRMMLFESVPANQNTVREWSSVTGTDCHVSEVSLRDGTVLIFLTCKSRDRQVKAMH